MSTDTDDERQTDGRDQTGSSGSSISAVLGPLRGSYALQAAAVGLVTVVLASVFNTGIWPAVLGIWGAALVLVGVGIHAAVAIAQRGSLG